MTAPDSKITSSRSTSAGDAEAIRHLEQAVAVGKHWYIALLEAMGLWTSAEETYDGRTYRYLIADEAFDWLLLAERLCQAVEVLLPDAEMNSLLFHGKTPLRLSAEEIKGFIGNIKYCQYLNYFYGITVERVLLLAIQEEVLKERQGLGYSNGRDAADEAYQRIYGAARDALLKQFRQERGYPRRRSISLAEIKEFTYWLFKYRLKHCEKARVASDTKKALKYLTQQWTKNGPFGALVSDGTFADPC